jgi:hypothetical protein
MAAAAATLCLLAAEPAEGQAPPPAPAAVPAPTTTVFARNWTRMEVWRFFEPPPGGGNPAYEFIANRLQAGLRHVRPRLEVTGAIQYVQFGGLPTGASGPGALGTGALYFDASQDTRSSQVYLKALNLRVQPAAGVTIMGGRMPYASGAESPSGVAAIETVKRQRLDARLIGEFEWSIYQRAYDGARLDVDRRAWRLTTSFLMPTQGGFEEAANVTMTRVRLLTAALGVKPLVLGGRTDLQLFGYRYDDERGVTGRPDNTGLTAARADIGMATVGAALTSVHPTRAGEVDALAWFAGQTGDWYGDTHRAYSLALEAGHRWPRGAWAPWLRGGFNYSSGDDDPLDARHGTFFQMLPTTRKYALSATYTQMNLRDVFGQVILRPRANLTARADVRRLDLARATDRWYAGSGATQARGAFFGYAGRASGGHTGLGSVVEGSVDWAINRRWSVNGYLGRMAGGPVVRSLFAGDRLTFFYIENVVGF